MSDSKSVIRDSGIIEAAVGSNLTGDEADLARMGYRQELRRDLTLFQSFGVSFSVINVIVGVSSLLFFGLVTGGPVVMVWGWVVVAFFTMLVGLAMAEICSAHPTSGGPYFWAAAIAKPRDAPFVSWITGWFNLLGQVAGAAGISITCANFIATAADINSDSQPSSFSVFGLYVAVLFVQGIINTFGVRLLRRQSDVSVWWLFLGTFSLVVAVLVAAPGHQSSGFVFGTFIDNTGLDGAGWSQSASPAYVVVIGLLMAQYTLTGFDTNVYMAEETHNAAISAPIGVVMSIGVSAVLGWLLILALLFSMQDYDATVTSATGQAVTQIFLDTVGVKGAIVLMVIVIGAAFFCGTFAIAASARMVYAFSRDGGIPNSKFFCKVNRRWRTPNRSVWLVCGLSLILGVPSTASGVAFDAITSISTIGLYISYGVPIALRIIYPDRFARGPFHLGKFSYPIAIVALLWIAFISIVFCLPQAVPVNSQTFNYTPVALVVVLGYVLGLWALGARKWFVGPVKQVEGEGPYLRLTYTMSK
ncbi:APC amino acid permease [Russula compacta]|nr:APC amino acid permease [Russula compacta]